MLTRFHGNNFYIFASSDLTFESLTVTLCTNSFYNKKFTLWLQSIFVCFVCVIEQTVTFDLYSIS
jgi:hypothetical protein